MFKEQDTTQNSHCVSVCRSRRAWPLANTVSGGAKPTVFMRCLIAGRLTFDPISSDFQPILLYLNVGRIDTGLNRASKISESLVAIINDPRIPYDAIQSVRKSPLTAKIRLAIQLASVRPAVSSAQGLTTISIKSDLHDKLYREISGTQCKLHIAETQHLNCWTSLVP